MVHGWNHRHLRRAVTKWRAVTCACGNKSDDAGGLVATATLSASEDDVATWEEEEGEGMLLLVVDGIPNMPEESVPLPTCAPVSVPV